VLARSSTTLADIIRRNSTVTNLQGDAFAGWLAGFAKLFTEYLTADGSIVLELGNVQHHRSHQAVTTVANVVNAAVHDDEHIVRPAFVDEDNRIGQAPADAAEFGREDRSNQSSANGLEHAQISAPADGGAAAPAQVFIEDLDQILGPSPLPREARLVPLVFRAALVLLHLFSGALPEVHEGCPKQVGCSDRQWSAHYLYVPFSWQEQRARPGAPGAPERTVGLSFCDRS
jgi:hypothetical protein